MVRRISSSRPMTGSSLPSRAACGEVAGEFLERVVAVLGAGGVGGAALAQLVDRGVERLGLDARQRPAPCRRRSSCASASATQQPLDGDDSCRRPSARSARPGRARARRHCRARASAARRRPRPRGSWPAPRRSRAPRASASPPAALDQPRGHALLVLEQRLEQMLGRDPLMVHADRDGLRRLQEALGAVGEFFEVHGSPRSFRQDIVLLIATQGLCVRIAVHVRRSAAAAWTIARTPAAGRSLFGAKFPPTAPCWVAEKDGGAPCYRRGHSLLLPASPCSGAKSRGAEMRRRGGLADWRVGLNQRRSHAGAPCNKRSAMSGDRSLKTASRSNPVAGIAVCSHLKVFASSRRNPYRAEP